MHIYKGSECTLESRGSVVVTEFYQVFSFDSNLAGTNPWGAF